MKKFLLLLGIAIAFYGCVDCSAYNKRENTTFVYNAKDCYFVEVITISHNGECHEYLTIRNTHNGSLCAIHWEGCKYCKNKQKSK